MSPFDDIRYAIESSERAADAIPEVALRDPSVIAHNERLFAAHSTVPVLEEALNCLKRMLLEYCRNADGSVGADGDGVEMDSIRVLCTLRVLRATSFDDGVTAIDPSAE